MRYLLIILLVSVFSSCINTEDFEPKGDVTIRASPIVRVPIAYGAVKIYDLIEESKRADLLDDVEKGIYKVKYKFDVNSDKEIKNHLFNILGKNGVTFTNTLTVPIVANTAGAGTSFDILLDQAEANNHEIDSFTVADNDSAELVLIVRNGTGTRFTLESLNVDGLDMKKNGVLLTFPELSGREFGVGKLDRFAYPMAGYTINFNTPNHLQFTVKPVVSSGSGNVEVTFEFRNLRNFKELRGRFSQVETRLPLYDPETGLNPRVQNIDTDALKPATYTGFNLEQKEYKAEIVISNGYEIPMVATLEAIRGLTSGVTIVSVIGAGANDIKPLDVPVGKRKSETEPTKANVEIGSGKRSVIKDFVDSSPSQAYFEVKTLIFPGAGIGAEPKVAAVIKETDVMTSSLQFSVLKATIDKILPMKEEVRSVKIISLNKAIIKIKGTSEVNADLIMYVEALDAEKNAIAGDRITLVRKGENVLVAGIKFGDNPQDITTDLEITKAQVEYLLKGSFIKISADMDTVEDTSLTFTKDTKIDITILLVLDGKVEVKGELVGSDLKLITQ